MSGVEISPDETLLGLTLNKMLIEPNMRDLITKTNPILFDSSRLKNLNFRSTELSLLNNPYAKSPLRFGAMAW